MIENNFFSTKENSVILSDFDIKIKKIESKNEFEKDRNIYISLIINSMEASPEQWNKNCSITINWIGQHFISLLNKKDFTKEELDNIFSICYRFLIELFLSMKNDLNFKFEDARKFANEKFEEFDFQAQEQIKFANIDMPIRIFKQLNNSELISNLKNNEEILKKLQTSINESKIEYIKQVDKVDKLKSTLKQYETSFNFVGLFDGFNELYKQKRANEESIKFNLIFFGILILLPFISEAYYIFDNKDKLEEIKNIAIYLLIPSFSISAILIYYFRIILHNYKSVKSQILQLELRKTLCQFIQSYTEYSSNIKKDDKEALNKFENIIFSGIVNDDEKLPSSFDGIEQISNLIKSIKS